MIHRPARLAVALALLLPACREPAPPRTARPAAAPDAGPAVDDTTGAMAPVTGDAPVDGLIRTAQRAVRGNPRRTRPLLELAQAFIRKARERSDPAWYEQARDAVDRALRIDRDDAMALQLQAHLLMQDHRFSEAREAAQRIIDHHPNNSASYGILGDAEMEVGHYQAAERAYQRMNDMRPNLASYARASWMRWLLGDIEGAIEVGQRAVAAGSLRSPEEVAWTTAQLGNLYLAVDDLDQAAQQYAHALQLFPDHPPSRLGMGRVLEARGDLPGAIVHYQAAVQGSAITEHLAALAEALDGAGRAAEAHDITAQLERAGRRSDPRTLSLFYANRDVEHAAAVELARRELTHREDDVYTEDALAWALLRAGSLDEAQAMSTRARRLNTPEARFLFHGGMIALARGDRAEARSLLSDALQLNAHFDRRGVAEARRALSTLGADAGTTPSAPVGAPR
jgi:tetratricopeptide (TPR) repeat protein